MKSLVITNLKGESDLKKLLRFMSKQPQYYPKYKDWLFGKCKERIEAGKYIPIIALSDNKIIGDTVYRVLPNGTVEIKNFRIDDQYRNRFLGRFLLRQVEVATNFCPSILDVTIDNYKGVEFFIHNGYKIIGKESIYRPGQFEYLMKKSNLST